jgi:hypothetical protein
MIKTTLFLAYNFIPSRKMNQQNNRSNSLNNNEKEKARRYRDALEFREGIAQTEINAFYASQ